MAVGFKKSLFGFNCDDVISYIEKTHKAHTEKEIVLKEQIEDLNGENDSLKEQIAQMTDEISGLEAKLKEFTDKYDEIERLSQNIGKLYLVAKTNAQTVMNEANACADIARNEVLKNITALNSTRESLGEIKENIVNTSAGFAKDIDSLTKSLADARYQIESHNAVAAKSEEEYKELIKVLSNE
ncbi:MAG: hypothetical protein J5662_01960 [Clostridia bacterium]|nr:hypothetical protein [Clostridia bacterium]